ncbi:MAG: signal peptidase I [Lachnospiraceae bacterium]|nr:signal peptidase I [Lachnospiraceae bacterium]
MKKPVRIIVSILAWILLIAAFMVTILVFSSGRNNGIASLMGFVPMRVESNSMKPTFKKGDLIICKKVSDVKSLKKGDVITFWTIIEGKRTKNTHRIVKVNNVDGSRSFVTRGDNNHANDEVPAYQSDLIGKWTGKKINNGGKAMEFLQTKKGFFICILIPMAIFFLFELYKFIFTIMEIRREGDGGAQALDEEEIKKRAIEEYLESKNATDNGADAVKDATNAGAEAVKEAAKNVNTAKGSAFPDGGPED